MCCWRNAVCACVFALLWASPVYAFSDPFAYTDAPEAGGGGGRWYTGSVADGYACDSCHAGGEPADLRVIGLPLDGYTPGSAYEVTVQWPVVVEHVALIAEFTDEEGVTSGTIQVPRWDAMQPAELCGPDLGSFPASEVQDSDDGRQLLSVIDCGATASRFLWTAPTSTNGDVWFNLGFVSADGDGDATGDGVTLVAQPLPSRRSGDRGTRELVEPACRVAAPGRVARSPVGWMLTLLVVARLFGARAMRRS